MIKSLIVFVGEFLSMGKRLSVLVMICLYCLIVVCVAHAQISVTLSAKPSIYSGICPAEIKFKGTITSEKPGKVQYRFVRSDGTLLPVETIVFSTPGAKEVKGSWTVGDARTPLYEGWQVITIVYPEDIESNRGKFKVTCDQTKPAITVNIRHSPSTARPGHELRPLLKLSVANNGAIDFKDLTLDIILNKDNTCPVISPDEVNSTHYSNGVLLKGGREQLSIKAGQKLQIIRDGTITIPAETPTGDYSLCAVINTSDHIKESNKMINCACSPIKIANKVDKPDLVIDRFSFKEGEKCTPGYPIYIFEVTVKNIGKASSPSLPNKTLVQVMDMQGSGWGNGVTLSSIPPGGTQTVSIPVYYFSEDPAYMTKEVPHPFRAVVDPLNLIEEAHKKNKASDIIYLDPGRICPK